MHAFCELAYERFHHPRYISPDPLEVVREYPHTRDREVVGLIASCLALGRVEAIVASVREVLARLGGPARSPAGVIVGSEPGELRAACEGFVYRFFDQDQLAGLLLGIREVLRRHGSLERCVAVAVERRERGTLPVAGYVTGAARGASAGEVATPGNAAGAVDEAATAGNEAGAADEVATAGERLITGLSGLVDEIVDGSRGALESSILLSRPRRGSACKRLFLYARWMVRSDMVDPGGWQVLAPADLLMPVDTHVLKVARALGMTTRRQATQLVSREITDALRRLDRADPVRFDFSLTRPGINPLLDEAQWLDSLTQSA